MENISTFFEDCERGNAVAARNLLGQLDVSSLIQKTREGRTCLHMAVISGDADLLRDLEQKLRDSGQINITEKTDEKGDTALHLAVRKNRVKLVERLVDLNANLCERANNEGETPLKLAVSLGFRGIVEFLVTRTSNAMHYIVELNQVRLVEYLIKRKVDLLELINQPYQPSTNPPDNADNRATIPSNLKEKSPINLSGHGGYKPSQTASTNQTKGEEKESTNSNDTQDEQPIVQRGDTPLHIAARNKYESMVNLLVKVPGVNKLARNSEEKTPFEVAREVTEYHESFRTIKKLGDFSGVPKAFMYCVPQVSRKKYKNAILMVNKAYEERRNAELVVAALLATMTCAAAFTVPGGFESESPLIEDLGSPLLISFTSFKLFIIFDCIAFSLSLFVCIMWEMSSQLTTENKMVFMTINSLVVCYSFAFTAYGFMSAVYAMLARKARTFSWVVLGGLIFLTLCGVLAFVRQSIHFVVKRARFHWLCGVSLLLDKIVQKVWSRTERCGLLDHIRSGDEVIHDFISGHCKFSGLRKEDEDRLKEDEDEDEDRLKEDEDRLKEDEDEDRLKEDEDRLIGFNRV